MKLHRLEITAFGPFAGSETVDFEDLNQAGVFLLNGDTGSGKTSVLDAICFALYGSATVAQAGGGRKAEKSDHADPGTVPVVRLEYTAARRRWRVERTPQWNRPSARAASGWVTQQSKVLLHEWQDGRWVERANRPDDAGQLVKDAVGLNREQFTQVMMLPQGRFARFLKAPSREREELLETLFGTDVYRLVQEELKDRASRATAELDALETDHDRGLQRTGELRDRVDQLRRCWSDDAQGAGALAAGHGTEEAGSSEVTGSSEAAGSSEGAESLPGEDRDVAAGIREVARDALRAERDVSTAHDRATRYWEAAAQHHRDLSERHRDLTRLTELRAREERVRQSDPLIESHLATLDAHHRATSVRRPVQTLDQAGDRATRAREAADEAWIRLHEGTPGPEAFQRALAEEEPLFTHLVAGETGQLGPVRDRALSARQEAQGALAGERDLEAQEEALEDAETHLSRLTERRDRLVGQREDAYARSEELQDGLAVLEDRAQDPALARRAVADAQAVLDATHEYHRLREALTSREREYRAAEDDRQRAASEVETLERRRFDAAVSTLAASLEEGSPCPVCGAQDHPSPATSEGADEVTEQTLAAARAHRQHCQEATDRCLGQLNDVRDAAATAQGRGALEDPDAARTALQEAREHCERVDQVQQQIVTDRARLEQAHRDRDEAGEQLRAVDVERAELAARVRTLRGEVRERREQLARDAHGFDSVGQRLSVLQDLITALETVQRAEGEADRARAEAESARHAVDGALQDAGFDSLHEARDAVLTEDREHELTTVCERHARERDDVRAELATERMAAVAALDEKECAATTEQAVDRAEQQARQQAARRDRLTEALGTLRSLRRDAEEHSSAVALQEQRLQETRTHCRRLQGLASVANATTSENSLRMTLTSFVLAARLEQVAAVASEHLLRMSSGRFSIVHTDRTSGGGKAGLGLEIDDTWTGVRRGTETLSGGESFFTSLALALGLADVVRAEAGGHDIDTLFVDEGFGSLDEDTLEQVLETIDGLRRHGRVIGLVSHVVEMKQRIDAQVVVTKTPSGSHLSVVRDPASAPRPA